MTSARSRPGVIAAALPAVALALAVAVALVCGTAALARGGDPAPAGDGAGKPPSAAPADVAILLSGGENGMLKPCGCSEPQRGGLSRRAAFWESARGSAKASAAVSLGHALFPRADPPQNALKADLFRATLSVMGYGGTVLSEPDFWVPGLVQPFPDPAETPRPPLNVKVRAGGPLAALSGADPILRLKAGDVPIRVVSVLDVSLREAVLAHSAEAFLDADKALAALEKEPGVLIVAAHLLREEMTGVAKAVEGKADVVIVVDVPGDVVPPDQVLPEARAAKPLIVHFDELGKQVGLLTLRRAGDAWNVGYRAVSLDPVFERGTSALRDQVDVLFAAYRKRVREERLLEQYPSFDDDGPTFVGSKACAECHAEIHESWAKTKHARALVTLEQKDYDADPECVRCHTVGWTKTNEGLVIRTKSSFQTAATTPGLAGVGCEDCHGPGSAHVADPLKKDVWGRWGEAGKRNWRHVGLRGCQTCHDVENSHAFPENYESKYLPLVDHRDVRRK